MLEKMIEDLTAALNANTAALLNSTTKVPGAGSISQPPTAKTKPVETEEVEDKPSTKTAPKKKAASKRTAVAPTESSTDLSIEDFRAQIGALVKPLGPLALKIGEKMAELGYEKVGMVPSCDRTFVLATLSKYQKVLLNGDVDDDEDEDMGFMG